MVTFFPAAFDTGNMQERTASPSTITVHAPHWPRPHPNLAPVSESWLRNTYSSGSSGSRTATVFFAPLTCSVKLGMAISQSRPEVGGRIESRPP